MNLSRSDFLRTLGASMAGYALGGLPLLGEPMVVPPPSQPGEPEVDLAFAVSKGPGFGRRISITFDDGPRPGTTEAVLDALSKRNLKATFFMIGKNVDAYPALAKRVLDEGHEIANHSYTHPALMKLSDEKVREELNRCQDSIEKATGCSPIWFRPPYGSFDNKRQGKLALERRLSISYWSVDPRDWAKPGVQRVIDSVLAQTQPGAIILLHDIHQSTVEAVPTILDSLLDRDYTFTTMSGFLGEPYSGA